MEKNELSQSRLSKRSGPRDYTLRITVSAICVAMALVLRLMSIMIPFGGTPSMRLSLAGIFLAIPAMLFGAIFGGIAGGIVDILGFLLDPQGGAYIPWLTVTAIMWGLLRGLVWKVVRNRSHKTMEISSAVFFGIILIFGFVNHISRFLLPASDWAITLSKFGKYEWALVYGLMIVGVLGLLGIFLNRLLFEIKNSTLINGLFLQVFVMLFLTGCVMTSINSYILWSTFNMTVGFPVYWIAKLIQEAAISVVSSFAITFLYPLFSKMNKN